jgi:hypothetical protein
MNSSRVRVEWPMVSTIGEGSGGGIRLRISPTTFALTLGAVIFRDYVCPDAPLLRTDGSLPGDGLLGVHCNLLFLCMGKVSIDIVFFKNEFLRMSVPLLRTIDLDALQIFKAVTSATSD